MTQDEIIRSPIEHEQLVALAREAGFNVHPRKHTISSKECLCDETLNELLERFAALVAANERESCAQWFENKGANMMTKAECATAIRNRSNK